MQILYLKFVAPFGTNIIFASVTIFPAKRFSNLIAFTAFDTARNYVNYLPTIFFVTNSLKKKSL